jgi:hypothetical protein
MDLLSGSRGGMRVHSPHFCGSDSTSLPEMYPLSRFAPERISSAADEIFLGRK